MKLFVTAALGLDIVSQIGELTELPPHHRDCLAKIQCDRRIWAAWITEAGPLTLSAEYDPAQSQSVKAYVLYFEWWIGVGQSHGRNWWHCYPKRPGEWISSNG
jgi:hypothetical protein